MHARIDEALRITTVQLPPTHQLQTSPLELATWIFLQWARVRAGMERGGWAAAGLMHSLIRRHGFCPCPAWWMAGVSICMQVFLWASLNVTQLSRVGFAVYRETTRDVLVARVRRVHVC